MQLRQCKRSQKCSTVLLLPLEAGTRLGRTRIAYVIVNPCKSQCDYNTIVQLKGTRSNQENKNQKTTDKTSKKREKRRSRKRERERPGRPQHINGRQQRHRDTTDLFFSFSLAFLMPHPLIRRRHLPGDLTGVTHTRVSSGRGRRSANPHHT